MDYSVIVTACGQGSRMKEILGDTPKYLINYRGNTLIGYIRNAFSLVRDLRISDPVILVGDGCGADFPMEKTRSRKETLAPFWALKDVFVVDCDILPSMPFKVAPLERDTLFLWDGRASGVYFIKDMEVFLHKMEGDNMLTGMTHPQNLLWETKHFGTPEEYHKHMAEQ